jgi:four helix bundle protein
METKTIKSYKDLIVWQKSIDLVLEIYRITKMFPKEEIYGITNQMRRAAVSIPSNIAEGSARKNHKELLYFLNVAFGSGAELETQIIITKKLELVKMLEFEKVNNLLTEVMKMIRGLTSSLTTNH